MKFCHIDGASYHWRPAPHALFRLPMACLPPRRCVPSSPLTPHCHLISKKCSGPCVDPPLLPSLLTTYHLPLLPSILATAFPFAICVLHFYTVLISCDALGGYASPSLSWPFFSSLSPVPSLSLSFSLSLSLFFSLSFSPSLSLSPPFSAPSHHSLYTWYLFSMPCNRRQTCHCPASAPRLTSCCSASLRPPGPHLRQTALVLPTCVHRVAVQVVPLGRRGTHHATKDHRRKYRSSCNLHLLVLACCSF